MIKVAYLPMLPDDAANFYRMSGPLDRIVHPGITATNLTGKEPFCWATLTPYNVLILQRPFTESHINFISLAKDMAIRVISDFDDDLLNVPVHNNASITLEEQKKNIKMCIHLSDEVWVTTPEIRKVYKPFNRNIQVIPNALDNYSFPVENKKSFNRESKLAVYRGGTSHEADLYGNVNDIANTINGNREWEFRFVGSRFKHIEDRTGKNHTATDPYSLMQFYKYYHEINAQVAFFPLLNNQFNKGKSNIFLLESTYAGSCVLANKSLPEFDYPFVTDIGNGLHKGFNEVKDDYDLMEQNNEEAWTWILENRLLSSVNKLREERLLNG